MSRMLRALRSAGAVARRDPALVWLAVRAFVLLVLMRGVITVFPLRWITRRLGEPQAETADAELPPSQARDARRIAWVIHRLSPVTPTTSNCYPQGLAARWLLRRHGIPSTLYYGAAFDEADQLEAHVWVRAGAQFVTGGGVSRRFAPLTYYADHPGPAGGLRRRRLAPKRRGAR